MHKAFSKKSIAYLAALSILFTGCGSIGIAKDADFESNYENTFEEPENIYVSSAQVMFKSYNSEDATIDFYVLGTPPIFNKIFASELFKNAYKYLYLF